MALTKQKRSTVAFAFDIDGVLIKGKTPIPGAREAIQRLQELHLPFIFLTNGGGLTEEAHVAKLGQRLELDLDGKQFVQSHTPYLDLVAKYADKNILVLGGHGQQIRDLAHAYGFRKVITSSDVWRECETVHPFPEMTQAHHDEHGRHSEDRGHPDPLHATQISAILLWSSPRDWCLDLQIVGDLLLSEQGRIGTRSGKNGDPSLPNNGYLQDGQPKLYFCNPDFEWSTSHDIPRFAQGAFREALRGVWSYATRGQAELEYTVVGKPTRKTFAYAERVLREYNDHINDTAPGTLPDCPHEPDRKIDTVYMIGDNPESDIVGANSFRSQHGLTWKSVLVETGVHVPGTKPIHRPTHVASDVKEAVEWVLGREDVGLSVVNVESEEEDVEDKEDEGTSGYSSD